MKKNKVYLNLLILVILAVIFYVSYGMLNIGMEVTYYSVSVIVEDSSSDRWNAFKEGLNQGIMNSRIRLNIVSTTEISSIEEECSIISREMENGADGIIVEMCSSKDVEGLFYQTVERSPVVLVNTEIEPESVYTVVSPDHYGIGAAIAEAVAEKENSVSGKLRIGVLAGNQEKQSMQQRLQGFRDSIAEEDAEIVWTILENVPKKSRAMTEYIRQNPVDVIVAMENDETEWAVDVLLDNPDISYSVYGEGRSEKAVYYLDQGVIQALVVPNEYYMGYQSVVAMAKKLGQQIPSGESREIDFLSVTKDRLYDKDIGEILFPIVR